MGFDTDCNGGEHSDLGKRVDVGPRRSSRGRRFRHYDSLELHDGLGDSSVQIVVSETRKLIGWLMGIMAIVVGAVWFLSDKFNQVETLTMQNFGAQGARISVLEADQKDTIKFREDVLFELRRQNEKADKFNDNLTNLRVDLQRKMDKP